MAQVAIAWTLSKPGVSAPIVGTTSLANLEDILSESSSRVIPPAPSMTALRRRRQREAHR